MRRRHQTPAARATDTATRALHTIERGTVLIRKYTVTRTQDVFVVARGMWREHALRAQAQAHHAGAVAPGIREYFDGDSGRHCLIATYWGACGAPHCLTGAAAAPSARVLSRSSPAYGREPVRRDAGEALCLEDGSGPPSASAALLVELRGWLSHAEYQALIDAVLLPAQPPRQPLADVPAEHQLRAVA